MALLRAALALLASSALASAAVLTPQPLTAADMEMLEECVRHTYLLIIDSQGTSKSVEGRDGPCAFSLVRKFFEDDGDYDDDVIDIMLVSHEAPVTMPMLESMLTVGKYYLETVMDGREPKIPALEKPFLNDTLEDAGVPAIVAGAIDGFVEERVMAAMDLLKAADFVEFPELMELSAAKTSLLLRPLFSAKDFDKALDELLPERPGATPPGEHEGDEDMEEEDAAPTATAS